MINSTMTKWVNSVIEGLNSKYKLPRYVMLLPDKDLIVNLNYFQYGVKDLYTDCLTWVVNQLDRHFAARREDLKHSKPGAVSAVTEPRIIWLAMITRPKIVNDRKIAEILTMRSKFNRVLEDVLANFRLHHLMYLDGTFGEHHFDRMGELTANGRVAMWKEINQQIHLFDERKIELRPVPSTTPKPRMDGDGTR